MERWQLWSGFFDFALLVLLQKATREANDNKIEHLWECSVDPNHSQLSLCPKSLHNSPIFPSGLAHKRGNFLESLIDLLWILRILRNLSVIPKSYLWKINVKIKGKSLLVFVLIWTKNFEQKYSFEWWQNYCTMSILNTLNWYMPSGLRYWFPFLRNPLSACHHCQLVEPKSPNKNERSTIG